MDWIYSSNVQVPEKTVLQYSTLVIVRAVFSRLRVAGGCKVWVGKDGCRPHRSFLVRRLYMHRAWTWKGVGMGER